MPERFRKSLNVLLAVAGLTGGIVVSSNVVSADQAGEFPAASAAVDIQELELLDQFGTPGGLIHSPEALQIAIVVSAKRLRRIKPWEQAIREHDAEVPLVRVADVPRNAPTDYQSVAGKLKKRLPEDLEVLIDLEGVWVSTFQLDSSVPNILIFDGSGTLLSQHAGMHSKGRFEALKTDIDRLRILTAPNEAQSP